MPVFDFTEIARADDSSGEQDEFELFARELLASISYRVLSGPGRGPDAGRDLIVEEDRTGVSGTSTIRWLVSCKHFAHSGSSVGVSDEQNIRDRVDANNCNAFMGFYSTLPSSPLVTRLEALRSEIEAQWLDKESIENILLSSQASIDIAFRFLPNSHSTWKRDNPDPAFVFKDHQGLQCEHCGKELLTPEAKSGIVVLWHERREGKPDHTYDLYWSCKGACDQALKPKYDKENAIDGWEDIPDICIPNVYMKWILATLNQLHQGYSHSDEALEKTKMLLFEVFPYVSRHLTANERERLASLYQIPSSAGGMG